MSTAQPPTADHSPDQESESDPSVGGILVHLVALLFGFVGAGVAYLFASGEYTKQNARNALNWQVTVILSGIVLFGAFVASVATESGILFLLSILGILVVGTLHLLFCLIATVKAAAGTTWNYPLTPQFVG
jgi:uncharacterized Tic20 family protein